jgi:hypothetical protein
VLSILVEGMAMVVAVAVIGDSGIGEEKELEVQTEVFS